jgi:enoyl-CoA hydratase
VKYIEFEIQDKIATVTISREESLNALNTDVLLELDGILDKLLIKFPKEVRALILTGKGHKAFVAGADIKEMMGLSQAQALEFSKRGQHIFSKIESLPFPVIAAVNGFALGGGLELALACDWIYLSENAQVGLPEVSLSLIPGFGGTARLVERIGAARAQELILTGSRLKSYDALSWGIANRVLPDETLLEECRNVLRKTLDLGPRAVAQAKRVIQEGRRSWLEQALESESESFSDLFNLADVKEGLLAFSEKRKPQYKGV